MPEQTVLVTGGAGYIGSHTVLELLQAGYDVVVVDSLVNSSQESLRRVEQLAGKSLRFYPVSLLDTIELEKVFKDEPIDSVIHFAGLKAVGESVEKPIEYYENNVGGSINLLKLMERFNVPHIVFSSSATVYGERAPVPYNESLPLGEPSSPYGQTKAMVERIIGDWQAGKDGRSASLLRYFNPIGAHESGLIGEDPMGVPNNLMPFIAQVAIGRRDKLQVFGNDYHTQDGSCERDYIHVVDLAKGHVAALQHLNAGRLEVFNLGAGQPTSVLQMIETFRRVNGVDVPFEVISRRAGDLPAFWADTQKVSSELGWNAQKTLEDMVRDTWRWQQKNPAGYNKK